jgi:hypothetical protein
MKRIELSQAWFGQCPRYLTAERFCREAGLNAGTEHIEDLIKQGVMPSRRIGRYLMVDMHQLMLMLPSHSQDDEFAPDTSQSLRC